MFGLVYYVDLYMTMFDLHRSSSDMKCRTILLPDAFVYLCLQNSAIRNFNSLAQMVLNQLFGGSVTQMVDVRPDGPRPNMYNAVLLVGGVQTNGDAVIYSLPGG